MNKKNRLKHFIPVIEHNRQDILTLAFIFSKFLEMFAYE